MSFTLPVQGLHQFDIFISTSESSDSGLSWKLEPKALSTLVKSSGSDSRPKVSFNLVETGDQSGLRISLSEPLESYTVESTVASDGTLV